MYFRAQRKSSQNVSLSEYIEAGSDGAPLSLMDVVGEEESLFDRLSGREDIERLRRAMQTHLNDRERQVLTLRYGLDGKEPQPQREVAQQTGISRSYVSHHAYCKR